MASDRPGCLVVRHGETCATQPFFTESILNSVHGKASDAHVVDISYSLSENCLTLGPRGAASTSTAGANVAAGSLNSVLARPIGCPYHELQTSAHVATATREEASAMQRTVAVAATIILQSADEAVLLTQRAAQMRTFPLVWVVPGGHVEKDESFEQAALREVTEEIGLVLTAEERATAQVLCMWESAYPALLSLGVPRRHHIVAYIHIKCSTDSAELLQRIKMDPVEVSAVAWVPLSTFSQALKEENGAAGSFTMYQVSKDGPQTPQQRPMSVLFQDPPAPGQPWEHLSSGTKYAIQLVLAKSQC